MTKALMTFPLLGLFLQAGQVEKLVIFFLFAFIRFALSSYQGGSNFCRSYRNVAVDFFVHPFFLPLG
jgi:ABC-type nitrate/sulfonate/bicarbonate transport system permease component